MAEPDREGFYGASVRRPVAVSMIVLTALVFGVVSFDRLRLNLLPDIAYPSITVRTEYPGAVPEDVEEKISKRIQESLATISHLVRIGSVSRAEISDVTLEFTWGTNVAFAMQDVREKLDRVTLPNEARRPILLRYDPNLDPVLRLGVSGDRDLTSLRKLCEDEIQREIETIDGVAAVRVRGGLEEEITISLDMGKLAELKLAPETVLQRLREENLNAAGGKLEEGDSEYIVRTLNEFRSVGEIRDIAVVSRGEARVFLKDVAHVERGNKEREVITRIDGKDAVIVDIHREADANIVGLARTVRERVFGREEQQRYLAAHPEYQAARREGRTPSFAPKAEPEEREPQDPKEKEEAAKRRAQKERQDKLEYERMTAFLAWKLPADIALSVQSDQSRFIQDSIDDVASSAYAGCFLAFMVIFLFLRQLVGTLIITATIPIAVIVTFAVMYLSKVSLNVMSLGGLALGIGMIVDDAIVVLESIARCREEGDSIVRAAIRGTREVGGAVISTELTTIAVFFPLLFVEGIAGQMFGDQALTVVTSLMISLVVSLTLIPMLASRERRAVGGGSAPSEAPLRFGWKTFLPFVFVKTGRGMLWAIRWTTRGTVWLAKLLYRAFQLATSPLVWAFDKSYGSFARAYPGLLRWSLAHPATVLLGSLVLLAAAAWRVPRLGSELLPEVHQGEFTAEVALGVGTPLARTDEILGRAEVEIRTLPEVESTTLVSGVERNVISSAEEGEHTAKLTVRVKRGPGLPEREDRAIEQVRQVLASRPEIRTVRFKKPTLFSFSLPIEIEVKGRELAVLAQLSRATERALAEIPELTDVRSTLRRGNPEVQVRFDRDAMMSYRLDTNAVADLLRTSVLGSVPTAFVEGEDRIDIRVRADEAALRSLAELEELPVKPDRERSIPLKSVAKLDIREGPSEIRRIGNQRAVVVTATSTGLDLGRTSQAIAERLAAIDKPAGYEIVLGGQKEEMDRALASMRFALYLSIFLVFIVMAAQFESLLQPLLIMGTVPLALVGAVFLMEAAGTPVSVISLIGVVILVGVVVDNATILLDRANQRRRAGDSVDAAILEAGQVRLRPIVMTALTTILGLLPLAGWLGEIPWLGAPGAGEGFELRAPMAIALIGGMVSSTALTLVVIPVCYRIAENLKEKYVRRGR